MNKNIFLSVIIIIFAVVFYYGTTDAQVTPSLPTIGNGIPFKPVVSQKAQSTTILFGGKIVGTKAKEVEGYENADYICEVPGSTIEIRPIKSSTTSYFIPFGTRSLTKYEINPNQSILGRSYGSQTITCKKCKQKDGEPTKSDEVKCLTVSIDLPKIEKFGNSAI